METERTPVSDATRQAEADEAQASHVAGRPASPQEEEAIDHEDVDDDVVAAEEGYRRGVDVDVIEGDQVAE